MSELRPHLLFVDDEQAVLLALQNLLYRHRRDWSLSFVTSAAEALALTQERPCDVVISDLRMPEMDGAELLEEIRRRSPSAIRIVLSGNADRESLLQALPVAHRLLSKPCKVEILRSLLAELAELLHERGRDDEDWRYAASLSCLPSDPIPLARFLDAVSVGRIEGMTDAAEQDPAIAAKLLQLAGLGCFDDVQKASTVTEAVRTLGPELIKRLALDIRVFAPAPAADVPEVHRIAARAAAQAREHSTTDTRVLLDAIGALSPRERRPEAVCRYLHGLWALPRDPLETR